MQILWLSHLIPYPPKGGVLQRSFNLVKELSKEHEVDLLAFNQKSLIGPLYSSVEEGVRDATEVLGEICGKMQFFDIPSDEKPYGRYALALKSLFGEPYNINWLKSDEFSRCLEEWLNKKDYDLVHFDTISLVPYLHILPPSLRTCLDHHNIESHMLLRRASKESNILKKMYFHQEGKRLENFEKKFCPQFSLNITCSDVDTENLTEIAPDSNVVTVPNGVDLEFFKQEGLVEKSNRIIFVGTMTWYPNIEAVLFLAEKLWESLKEKFPDLECDIIGANPPQKIFNLSKRFADFHVHGFVDDVRPYIESAAIYVCPIQDGGGTKLKILDAMAMSKAIVAHPLACEGIEVEPDVNVFLATDQTSFIEKIITLLNSKNRRDSLGREARLMIEQKYGYSAIGQKLSMEFEELK